MVDMKRSKTGKGRNYRFPRLAQRLSLGKSRLVVSPFCHGMISTEASSVIPATFDVGVNFFFISTDLHWPGYESMRRGLQALLQRGGGIRDRIVVAATSYLSDAQFAAAARRELLHDIPQLERLDVLVFGGLRSESLVPRLHDLQDSLARNEFGARAIGASFHEHRAAATAQRFGLLDIAFARYNPSYLSARNDLFPYLSRASSTLLYNFKSTTGYLGDQEWRRLKISSTNWRPCVSDYYRFALSAHGVDGILGSLGSLEEVADLRSAFDSGTLSEQEQNYLIDIDRLSSSLVGGVTTRRRE